MKTGESFSRGAPDGAAGGARFGSFEYEPGSRRLCLCERGLQLFGLPARSAPALDVAASRIHPADCEGVLSEWETAAAELRRTEVEYRVARPDGSWRWLSSLGEASAGEGGRVRIHGVTIDVSDRRAREDALRDADRRKDEFLATLSHELRSPLAPIVHSLEILERDDRRTEASARASAMIRRQVGHMANLLDDLFDVTRIREGKLRLRPSRLELGGLLRDAVDGGRPAAERAGQILVLEVPAEPIHVEGDPVRLAQVFGNLLSNASRYTAQGGEIRVEARRMEASAIVTVSDNGAGIPREMLPRVFDMFAQAEGAADGGGGLGVGLALVKRLVELHRGAVSVESGGPGRGSRFTVTLPLAVERRRSPRPIGSPDSAARLESPCRRRVLVVDDNRDGAESLTELLRLTGHDAIAIFDGAAAVSEARTYRPEIVLLDIGLPEMSGYDVCRALRAQPGGRDVAIVAVTGLGQDADRARARDAGFSAHLVKPVSYAQIVDLITSLAV